ncbi:MAG: phage capsid protein [Christensenellaceae bacterium]|nr:phage capsid protein [Christensenellaceae bacterium]
MPITLEQAKQLRQDKLTQCVIDEFRKSPLLDMLVFDNTVLPQGGSTLAYSYNRVTTLPTAASRAINAEYVPQETVTTQVTVNLKIFGGSFQVDRVIANNQKQVVEHIPFQVAQKSAATRALFADLFINGDSGLVPTDFDGIDKAVTGSSTEHVPGAAIDLSTSENITANFHLFMDTLDKWLATMDGMPSALMMNRAMLAIMNGIARRSGYFSTSDVDAFGRPVTKYQGIPLMDLGDKPGTSNPIIATAAATGETAIYAARFALDGVHGVSPSGSDLVNVYLPDMTASGAVKTGEVEMVAAVALKATRAAGVLRKIKIA